MSKLYDVGSSVNRPPDNGGPPLDDEGAKLRWVKVNITEILEGIEELSWEQRGYYLTALFKMYARMGGLPADKYEGAKAMRCDVRFFQRLRDQIVATGKFYIEDGLLKNSRVEREIADYVREFKRRRDAALEREQRKREADAEAQKRAEENDELHSTSGGLLPEVSPKSPRSPGEVSETSGRLGAENPNNSIDAPPQHYHKATTNQNQEPEPDKEREERKVYSSVSDETRRACAEAENRPGDPAPKGVPGRTVAREAFAEWQDFAAAHGLARPRDTTFDAFAPQILARMREHAEAQTRDGMLTVWRLALCYVAKSKFLRGMQTDFKADLGSITRPKNFAKLISGGYGNGASAADERWKIEVVNPQAAASLPPPVPAARKPISRW